MFGAVTHFFYILDTGGAFSLVLLPPLEEIGFPVVATPLEDEYSPMLSKLPTLLSENTGASKTIFKVCH